MKSTDGIGGLLQTKAKKKEYITCMLCQKPMLKKAARKYCKPCSATAAYRRALAKSREQDDGT